MVAVSAAHKLPGLLAAAFLAACSTGAPESELSDLRAAARGLVPASSEVLETKEGACVQLRGNPDCTRVYFTSDLPEASRVDELMAAARGSGWEIVSRRRVEGGTVLELRREGYRAFAAIRADERAAACRLGPPEATCADELQVVED
jgi:hypothetical protein